ncbi:AT-hook motif nuclear-localized protein 17 [Ananas comosus]|uniref:AT-hook motif nuclear-localized protein n=1 Tax=Ananas comosus TaxID=4615 RepID=A0A199VGK2_ANACO|nr:AT-hook motif nuclear-localized protein 17 [Ananas comosus]
MECYSDEVDSEKSSRELTKNSNNHKRSSGGCCGTAGAVKRPRGRPPGSKNKRKRPVNDIAAEPLLTICTHILEIPAGRDVAVALAAFARGRRLGLCVLAASGPVDGVTLRGAAGAVALRGRFNILSVSAAFLPPPAAGAGGLSVSVAVAGPQGRVVGGVVAGPLVAAGTVVVVAAAFSAAAFHQLPGGSDVSDALLRGGSGGGDRSRIGGNNDDDDEQELGSADAGILECRFGF